MANSTFSMPLTGLVVAAIALMGSGAAAAADHACDPVDPVMENGWTVVPSDETVTEADSAPFEDGARGNWFVTRTTRYIPFCNYYNEIGIYSLRSYSLAPRAREDRISICRATTQGGSVAIAPYAGPCPPRAENR
jgi:hypothetical protein